MNERRQIVKIRLVADHHRLQCWRGPFFFVYRKTILEPARFGDDVKLEFDSNYVLGLIMPFHFSGSLLYYVGGQYVRIYQKTQIKRTWTSCHHFCGRGSHHLLCITTRRPDQTLPNYYETLLVLFWFSFCTNALSPTHLSPPAPCHWFISGKIGFNTIIVGGNAQALSMYEEIMAMRTSPGFKFEGFVSVNGQDDLLTKHIPLLR
jgi:hypothetical protein